MKNQFFSIRVIKAKNINSIFGNNQAYKKINYSETTPIYDFTPDSSLNYDVYRDEMIIAKWDSLRVYISSDNYAFIVTGYKYKFCMESTETLNLLIYRAIMNTDDTVNLPETQIVHFIRDNYKEENIINFIAPYDVSPEIINLNIENSVSEFLCSSPFYFYSFDTNLCLDSDIVQQLKTITECGWLDSEIQPEIPLVSLNDSLYQISGKYGVGIIMHGPDKLYIDEDTILDYLKGLQQTIYTITQTNNNNKLLDEGLENKKDIEILKSSVLKDLRKIVHIKNDIKKAKNRSISDNIYNIYMENGPFSTLIDDFEESCNSIKDELEIESERREAKRSSMFDKTLAIIGIMALVSAFKDGSDLNITGLEMFNTPVIIGFIDLIKVASPIICLVLIVILVILIFKKK